MDRFPIPARHVSLTVLVMIGGAALIPAPYRADARPANAAGAGSASMPGPTGKVIYRYTCGPMSGTSSLTWENNGKHFRQDVNLMGSVTPGSQSSIQTWILGDGKNTYTWLPFYPKKVYRSPLPKPGKNGSSASAQNGPGGLPGFGVSGTGKLLGKATILGKPCEVRKLGQATFWNWKGLSLKMVVNIASGPQMTVSATEIETPFQAPPGTFRIPHGYQVIDGRPPMPKMGAGGLGGGGATPPVRKGTQ